MKKRLRLQERAELFSLGRKTALLLFTPVMAFYLMQFIYGGELKLYSWEVVLANAVCIAPFYYLFCGLTGRLVLGSVLTLGLAFSAGAANYFVRSFRGTPILPWDLTALRTALAVSGSYRFHVTWRMGLVGIAAICGILWRLTRRRRRTDLRIRAWWNRLGLTALGLVCAGPWLCPEMLEEMGISPDVWDQGAAYGDQGVLAVFLCNTEFMEVEVPEGYTADDARLLLEETVQAGEAKEEKSPHIIAIMNESWADFECFGNLTFNEPVMEYIHSLDGIKGYAYASVFGAGTSASEFEFLTGNSMAFLPSGSIPYQQYILAPSSSMASVLKEQGYRCVAIHPGEKTSWQRDRAYPLLGFDTFKWEDMMDVELTQRHGYVSDYSSFEQIIYEFEHRDPGERLFVFNVTIQNHGSYTDHSYQSRIYPEGMKGAYPMAEQYLTLVNETDRAFEMLVEYFRNQEEPVVILMFGDHQPSLEQEFLDLAYGVKQEDMTMEQYMDKFLVPYVIWSNKETLEGEGQELSLNFLGQKLLSLVGIATDDYGTFLEDFCRTLPVLTFAGYKDSQGEAYSYLETNDWPDYIERYRKVQYYHLFDCCDKIF